MTTIVHTPAINAPVEPFAVEIPQHDLDDLERRLDAVRWPERAPVADWSQGVPLAAMQELVEHWRQRYDWRRGESELNSWPQFRTRIDGLDLHFVHIRSPHEQALPLLITHGWPGSVFEFVDVFGFLSDPTRYGGRAEDSFHVVAPSLPGYGFSGRPAETGWGRHRIARAWSELMKRLGYERYVAQGGDWGAIVTTVMAQQRVPGLAAIHLNFPLVMPEKPPETPAPEEQRAFDALAHYFADGAGYFKQQSTRPQTLGYALADSPAGQAAWIYEKYQAWMDYGGDPRSVVSIDRLLDNITLYWLTNTAASSARMYRENADVNVAGGPIDIPVGCSIFPAEIYRPPRLWAERCYRQLIHWNELDRGGHFAAMEQPKLFVDELRRCFRGLRN